ncbi:MAG: DUF4333 domain-containing protein [Leptolyngbyaceae cyanobacterium bins.302]|nr:DUF4333 domain-containing protein [Leptolyngbyaceae cyanobacterium bins.302]
MMQRGWTQINQVLWLGVGAIAIVGCSNDSQKIAAQIQQDITANGGTSLKTVTCPSGVKPEPGKTFECVGEMDNGYTFTITVQPQDDKGTAFTWDVPHAKGLVNVPKLESVIQENLSTEIGSKPTVACGGIYKAVKPGEGFECQITYKLLKPAPKPAKSAKGKPAKAEKPIAVTQTEKVTVTTDDSGNVSWQRVLPQIATKPKPSSTN